MWKIIVLGIKKIKSREQVKVVLSQKIKRITPLTKIIVETIHKIKETEYGKPLLDINSNWLLKFKNFPGIAFTKIALGNNLPRKFKEKILFLRFMKSNFNTLIAWFFLISIIFLVKIKLGNIFLVFSNNLNLKIPKSSDTKIN